MNTLVLLLLFNTVTLLMSCTSTKSYTYMKTSTVNGKKESPHVLPSTPTIPENKEEDVYQNVPHTLIVEASQDFDMSLLENKEEIKVLDTLVMKDILYIHIQVLSQTPLTWIRQLENVLAITEDPIRTLH